MPERRNKFPLSPCGRAREPIFIALPLRYLSAWVRGEGKGLCHIKKI